MNHSPDRTRETRPVQFGLRSLIAVVWLVAAAMALIRWLVVWPTLLTLLVVTLIIDHRASRQVTRSKSTFVAVLSGLMLTAVLLAFLLSIVIAETRR